MSTVNGKSESFLFVELSNHVKTKSKSGIISCLNRLKSEPKCYKQFVKDGGLELLINLLRHQNLKILNITLSILANACITSDIRKRLIGTKIAYNVVCIVKNFQLDNTLHCRACRLIGNLSECCWHAKSLCDAGSLAVLADLLQLQTNMQTRVMAVRAVRNIWSTYKDSRGVILDMKIIRYITNLLIMAKEKMNIDAKYSDLVDVCLKAMSAMCEVLNTKTGTLAIRCGEQMEKSFKCIVECCNVNNKMAIKCLYNLSQISEWRPILGCSGAIENLILLINKHSELSKETLGSLCLFCRESVNRAKIRINSGLQVMLMILKQKEHECYHPMLLHALVQFVYDDSSVLIMIKYGLLDVLVNELKKMVVVVLEHPKVENIHKKKSYDFSMDRRTKYQYYKTILGQGKVFRYTLDYRNDNWSPSSTASMLSSPPSTPPSTDCDADETFMDFDENTEDNYSPVCSDSEWGDNADELQEEVDSLKSCKSLTIEKDKPLDSETFQGLYCKEYTLALLRTLTYSSKPVDGLAHSTTIESLSAYIGLTKNPRASRILIRIVRNSAYFIPLLKQGFVFEAQTLYGSEQYTKKLCALAETGGAIGEMTSILIHGEESHKLNIAISIPFLIKNKSILKSLLITHGGLQLIFRVLNDQDHNLYENAIWSICRLANTLQIRPSLVDKGCAQTTDIVDDHSKFYENLAKPALVTFELDDGTTVDACRQILCQRSDVFFAMLEGNFSESGKRKVKLRNTTNEGLNTLILAANGGEIENRSIESLLDAVLLADKFLMSEISSNLTESAMAKLNYENFNRAWNWARNNSCCELRSYCVKRFLTAKMTRTETVQGFRGFSGSECFHEFLNEVRDILINVLCLP